MASVLKEEFKWKNFGFHHDNAECFVTPQWQWHPSIFVAFRIIAALYSVACFLAVTLMSIGDVHPIVVFLTIWTYLVLCLYLIVAAVVAVIHWCKPSGRNQNTIETVKIHRNGVKDNKHLPTYGVVSAVFENDGDVKREKEIQHSEVAIISNGSVHSDSEKPEIGPQAAIYNTTPKVTLPMKLSWLLADIVYVFALVVTLVYFTALFPSIGVTPGFGNDLNMHAFNSILVLLDVAIVARPSRLLHVIYPVVYGVCYIIFSVIYWSLDHDGNVLYPGVLDWNKPGATAIVIAALALIGIPLLQLAHFGLYRLRLVVYRKIYDEEY